MSDPVGNAVNTIKDNLSEGWLDWDVSHGDLTGINDAIAGLTPEQRSEAFGQLSQGDIEKWAGEINGTLGSLSAGERQDLFNNLAQGLSADQLATLTRAFAGNPDSVIALGQAVGTHASANTRVDYVAAMAGDTNTGDATRIDSGFGYANSHSGDPEALAVAHVLNSLSGDGASLDRAVGALSDSQLAKVAEAAAGRSMLSAGGGNSVDYDPTQLVNLVNAAASSGDVSTRARVYEAASAQLGAIEGAGAFNIPYVGKGEDAAAVGNALTGLLNSDPNGIVSELQAQVDPTGEALATHVKHLLDTGQEAQVRTTIQQLQHGNDGSGNAYQNFGATTDVDGQATYLNARNLGYFAGATGAAINAISSDKDKQAELLKNIFGTGFGAVGAINTPAGVIASAGNGITSATITSITESLKEGDKDLKQALYELSIPANDAGRLYNGPARTDFNSSYAVVPELNR